MKNYKELFKFLSTFEQVSKTEDSIFELEENGNFLKIKFVIENNRSGLNYRVRVNYTTGEKNEIEFIPSRYECRRRKIDELEFLLDSDFNIKFSCFYNYTNKYRQPTDKKIKQKIIFRSKDDKNTDKEIFKMFEVLELKEKLENDLDSKEEIPAKRIKI